MGRLRSYLIQRKRTNIGANAQQNQIALPNLAADGSANLYRCGTDAGNDCSQCKDRTGLLVDISTAMSTCKVNVNGLNVHTTSDGFAIFHLTISVTDSKQLEQVMRKIHMCSSSSRTRLAAFWEVRPP